MTLIDTSAWVAFLRGDGSPADRALASLLADHARVFITDLVAAELLARAPDESAVTRVQRLVASLDRSPPPGPLDVERAAHLFRLSRDAGTPLRSLTSALTAVVALRDGHEVLAAHQDFHILHEHTGLRLYGSAIPTPNPATFQAATAYVLVIEDEPSAARMLEDMLARPDRHIAVATTGREARARLSERAPDAIVLDLVLPDEDGRSLLPDLRREPLTKDTGVVVVTGKAGPRTREECFALGADAFFAKPFDAGALARAVDAVLQEGRSSAPDPDPLLAPLTLSEVQKVLSAQRDDGGSARSWTVGLFEIDTDRPSADRPNGNETGPDRPAAADPPLLPTLLRTAIEELQRRLRPGELIARWGADQLVVVSPSRAEEDMQALLSALSTLPPLEAWARAHARTVQEGEDLLDAVSKAASGAPGTAPSRERPRVALVEDDPITAALVRHRLARSGFAVEHYTDGARGLEGIAAAPPDVAILDVQLPSMDGFEILGRLRESEATRRLPVLMFTSLGRQEHVQRGFELGADDYVTKPFSPSELLTRVLRLVRHR